MKKINEYISEAKLNDAERMFEIVEKVYRGTGSHGGKEADDVHAVINLFDELCYYVRDMFSASEHDDLFCKEIQKIIKKSLDDFDY